MHIFGTKPFRAFLSVLGSVVLAVGCSTTPFAQSANDMMRIFGVLMQGAIIEGARAEWRKVRTPELACIEQQLQQQGASTELLAQQGIFPNDGRIAALRVTCARAAAEQTSMPAAPVDQSPAVLTNTQPLSSGPTFDCTGVRSALGTILCADKAGAIADWNIDAAFRAQRDSLPETDRDGFSQAYQDWIHSVSRTCRLSSQPDYSPQQRQCVLNTYNARTDFYRSKLRGDALAESRLSPEARADLQTRLIDQGFLNGDADGQFGPITRDAIRRFQDQRGDPQTGFLSSAQRTSLGQTARAESTPPATSTSPKMTITEAEKACQGEDNPPEQRAEGCTVLIDAKAKASTVALADAYDGRCRAYNDSKQYQLALDDCKAAIARNARHAFAFDNLGSAYAGLGDYRNAIAAYTQSIELKPTFKYSYLGRAFAFIQTGEREKAKADAEQVFQLDPGNQQASAIIASLAIDTPTLKEARTFLDDIQQFVSQSSMIPSSLLSEIATTAGNLEIALKKFDERGTHDAEGRLNELLTPISGFQEFLAQQQTVRGAKETQRLAKISAEGTGHLVCIDNYVKNHLVDSKNASLNSLRTQIGAAIQKKDTDGIETANTAFLKFVGDNAISCPPPSAPQTGTISQTAALKAAETYLADVQAFLATHPKVEQDKISDLSLEAKGLKDAIDRFDEAAANQSRKQLDDLLKSTNGFIDFMADRETSRNRELDRRFATASEKAEKGVEFVTQFLPKHLAHPATERLLLFEKLLHNARQANDITGSSLDEIDRVNEQFEKFITAESLTAEYNQFVKTLPAPPPPPATEKNRFLVVGPSEDMIFLYNASPSAPSITKHLDGRFVFETGTVSVCFAQSNKFEDDRLWFVERWLHEQGSKEIKESEGLCNLTEIPSAYDIVIFQRGELLNQTKEYISGLLGLVQTDGLRQIRLVTEADYSGQIQAIRADAIKNGQGVESGTKRGFGVLVMKDSALPACVVAADEVTKQGLKVLLHRDKELISRRLRFDLEMVDTTVDTAFVALSKLQCGYAVGDSNSLLKLVMGLRGEGKQYEFSSIWYAFEDVIPILGGADSRGDSQISRTMIQDGNRGGCHGPSDCGADGLHGG